VDSQERKTINTLIKHLRNFFGKLANETLKVIDNYGNTLKKKPMTWLLCTTGRMAAIMVSGRSE